MARSPRRLLAPIGRLPAFLRYLRDPGASLLGKLFIAATIAYVVMPVDLLPDAIPVLGWLDDLGLSAVALAYALRVIDRYRDAPPASVA
jgi:uncharacterized membrane protein YkvA (DUF1232 family)